MTEPGPDGPAARPPEPTSHGPAVPDAGPTPYGPAGSPPEPTPSGPAAPPPDPEAPPSSTPARVRGRNEAAGTAVVLAVLALIGALVPVLDLVTGLLAVVGAAFGILALTRKRRRNSRRLAITGLALNVVVLTAWVIAITTLVGLVLDTYPPTTPPEGAASPGPTAPATPEIVYPVTLTVELTGTVPQVRTVWLGGLNGEYRDVAAEALPLTQEHDVLLTDAAFSAGDHFSVTAVLDEADGTVTCRVGAGDRILAEDTASGRDEAASCRVTAFDMRDYRQGAE